MHGVIAVVDDDADDIYYVGCVVSLDRDDGGWIFSLSARVHANFEYAWSRVIDDLATTA